MKGKDFFSLLDLFQNDNQEGVYIDAWHYGDRASARIAERVAELLSDGGYLGTAK